MPSSSTMVDSDDEYGASSKGLRLPTFSGAAKDFQIYWTRFTAFAAVYRFAQAVRKTKEANLPNKEEGGITGSTAEEKKAQKDALRRNTLAVANSQCHSKQRT